MSLGLLLFHVAVLSFLTANALSQKLWYFVGRKLL